MAAQFTIEELDQLSRWDGKSFLGWSHTALAFRLAARIKWGFYPGVYMPPSRASVERMPRWWTTKVVTWWSEQKLLQYSTWESRSDWQGSLIAPGEEVHWRADGLEMFQIATQAPTDANGFLLPDDAIRFWQAQERLAFDLDAEKIDPSFWDKATGALGDAIGDLPETLRHAVGAVAGAAGAAVGTAAGIVGEGLGRGLAGFLGGLGPVWIVVAFVAWKALK